MFDSLQRWINQANEAPMMEQMSNEKMIGYLTSPTGLGIAVGLIIVLLFLKQRLSAVIVTALIAGIYVVRYTITDTSGPNDTIFLFIGGAAALGGFIIYFTLMKEE